MSTPKRVAIIQKYIPRYRMEFFNQLRELLVTRGIELILIYGQPETKDRLKEDAVEFPWGYKIQNRIIEIRGHSFYWQPAIKYLNGINLVIVEQANKLLINNVLLFLHSVGRLRLAYWGHGKNFQRTSAGKFSEHIKRITSTKVDWWFAYTKRSAEIVHHNGFPLEKITIVQNTFDTTVVKNILAKLQPHDLEVLRSNMGIKSHHVGLYIGGIYKEKNIEFLLNSCAIVRNQIDDFELIIVGAGPDADIVVKYAENHPWLKYVGPKFDAEKVKYFAISDLILLPDAVGLAVIDSFALGKPIVTCTGSDHGPEIDYLINNVNGVIVQDDSSSNAYALEIAKLFMDEEKIEVLSKGCLQSSNDYSISVMVNNFADGIEKALNTKNE